MTDRSSSRPPSAPGSSGRSRVSNGVACTRYARARRDGADGVRAVPGDHLDRHALGREVGDGVGGVGSQLLGEHDEGHRAQANRERLAVQGAGGARQREDTPPAGGQVRGPGQQPVLAAGEHDFRCSQHPGAVPGEAGRAPLARGGERHAVLARPLLQGREGLPDGGQRRIWFLAGGERAERRLGPRLVIEPDQAGTRPCGTMPTSAATVEVAASCRVSLVCSWLTTSSTATGGSAQVT